MDPKMDSGCLAPGETLDEEYDVTRPLLPAEVLGIMDQLLCLEMAWHLGYPLSQTLLTNVYIEALLNPEPKTIEEADFVRPSSGSERGVNAPPRDPMLTVLRAYCLGLIKTCWYVVDRIRYEHYYEVSNITRKRNKGVVVLIQRRRRTSSQTTTTGLSSRASAATRSATKSWRLGRWSTSCAMTCGTPSPTRCHRRSTFVWSYAPLS